MKAKNSNKSATNTPQTRNKNAAKVVKMRDVSPKIKPIGDVNAAEVQHIRYAYAPLLQQFRSHTAKNQARLWMPIETNLISRYEFATLTTHTRYIFVAIMLYCAGNGIDEIPLDAKFMSSILNADFRSIENSFAELLLKNLLVEREKREKREERKDNTTQDNEEKKSVVVVCDFENSSEESESKNKNGKPEAVDKKESPSPSASMFSLAECLRYAEAQPNATNPHGLANYLFKTGEADSFILSKLYPEKAIEKEAEIYGAPVQFSEIPCSICYGAKMADVEGRGFRPCEHCKNERGKPTGFEPQGENDNETVY